MDLAGGTPLIIRRLIVPLAVTAGFISCAVQANAQGAFPAPLPGQAASPFPPVNGATPANNASPFPPVNGAAPAASFGQPSAFPSNGAAPMGQGFSAAPPQGGGGGGGGQECMKEFLPLKQDAEKKGEYLQALGKRKNKTVQEACKGFTAYSQAEAKMMKFVEANAQRCGIPADVPKQMKEQHIPGVQARNGPRQRRVRRDGDRAGIGRVRPDVKAVRVVKLRLRRGRQHQ